MRYFIAVLVVIVLIIFGVVLFSGGSKPHQPTITPKTLPDYAATDASVRLIIDGQINGDENHRAIRITIDKNERQVDIIQGYQGSVMQTQSFGNNESAYNNFLHALVQAGFTMVRKTTQTDETGICPLGNRYTYELDNTSDKKDFSRWSTSCGGEGTYGGQPAFTRSLFENQIPDYNDLTNNVQL